MTGPITDRAAAGLNRPLRLVHFDIPTEVNYGDIVLFPLVKEVFESYGGGGAFEFAGSLPLRDTVTDATVDFINDTADAIVVGGGGLFLADSNRNTHSGWQWKISLERLKRLDVPIIMFAVGYNRFYKQEDFTPPFPAHLRATMEQSVFFGVRNHGSMERIADYVPTELRDKIVYQPCPTTLSSELVPLSGTPAPAVDVPKRIGVQGSNGKRQRDGGIPNDLITADFTDTVTHLEHLGWDIVHVPFHLGDEKYAAAHIPNLTAHETRRLYGPRAYRDGFGRLSDMAAFLGTRGHAQMVPFGMGAMPFSVDVHPKLGNFLDDIGRPEWLLDPFAADFGIRAAHVIDDAWTDRVSNREHLAAKQAQFLGITQDNLAAIYRALGGDPHALSTVWAPYTAREFALSDQRLRQEIDLDRMRGGERKAATARTKLERELAGTRKQLRQAKDRSGRQAPKGVAETATLLARQTRRALIRRGEAVAPAAVGAARRIKGHVEKAATGRRESRQQ